MTRPARRTLLSLVNQGVTASQIATLLGHPQAAIIDWMESEGISIDKTMAPKNKRSKGGRRKDIPDVKGGHPDGLFVRSSWEANVARVCMFQKKTGLIHDWAFESIEFEFPVKRGCTAYIPDFTIIEKEGDEPRYLEVKGYMDQKSRTKLKRMGKYYPEVRVDVIAAPEMKQLAASYRGVIPNWEGR